MCCTTSGLGSRRSKPPRRQARESGHVRAAPLPPKGPGEPDPTSAGQGGPRSIQKRPIGLFQKKSRPEKKAAMNTEYEVIVIGGGPAGYSLGIRLAQAGQRVAVIEREGVGGVCLNWGCVPSKALITTAQRLRWAREGADFGVEAREVRLDLTRAQARSRGIVHHHTSGVASLLKTNGADLIVGAAQLTSRRTVRVQQKDGS